MKTRFFQRIVLFLFIAGLAIASLSCDSGVSGDDDDLVSWVECRTGAADSTSYFVSFAGDDDADGTSVTTAFKTISRALQAVRPGGTVRILPGTYYEGIGLLNCGTETDSLTIIGQNGIPVLDGQDSEVFGFFCENCANVFFNNLLIQNYTDIGIGVTSSRGITIQNMTVRENGHAVQLVNWELEGYGIHVENSEYVTIANNYTYSNGPRPQIPPDRLMGTGINTYGNRHVTIRNNYSYNNTGGGILVEDSYEVLVENNAVFNNDLDASSDGWWDGGLWLDGGGNVTIRNNSFTDNLGPGIEISDEDLQNPTGYILEDNVSTGNYYGIFIWNFGSEDWPPESVLQRSGNQFSDNTRQDIWIEAGY